MHESGHIMLTDFDLSKQATAVSAEVTPFQRPTQHAEHTTATPTGLPQPHRSLGSADVMTRLSFALRVRYAVCASLHLFPSAHCTQSATHCRTNVTVHRIAYSLRRDCRTAARGHLTGLRLPMRALRILCCITGAMSATHARQRNGGGSQSVSRHCVAVAAALTLTLTATALLHRSAPTRMRCMLHVVTFHVVHSMLYVDGCMLTVACCMLFVAR